ncbi:hypothetical protein V8G54_010032 [Vigna mungo]|uniref:Homeobox domain-containing protein n=1 Tax=Vigna mungo TaxID=3915 RepID=A0AAQ3NX94_VIGMU
MGEKDDGLGLRLSLRWGENDDNNMNEQHPFKMHKPPQPVPNQRASSFNRLFHFHGASHVTNRSSEPPPFFFGIDMNLPPPPPPSVAPFYEENGVSSPNSAVSSMSGKRSEREENERGSCSRGGSEDDDGGGCGGDVDGDTSRKKLRLLKEQALVLEETFKEHNTLNPKQKQALAKQLNLSPRQVEVWFQNRRARTKLKQTEVDCEYLKKCYENLTEDNRRLQKEVQELRALKFSPQLYMHMNPPTTLTMCPSCERVAVSSASSSSAAMPSVPPPANHNPLGPTIRRPVPVNPWAAMSIQHHPPA